MSGVGIVVARLPDGSWSPPSAFAVSSAQGGRLDARGWVCVLRTRAAVEAFTRSRVSLGRDVGLAPGPMGVDAETNGEGRRGKRGSRYGFKSASGMDHEGEDGEQPIWSYTRPSSSFSRGLHGVTIEPRSAANADFYGESGISVDRILRGDVLAPVYRETTSPGMWPHGAARLHEALRRADADPDADTDMGGNLPVIRETEYTVARRSPSPMQSPTLGVLDSNYTTDYLGATKEVSV